MSNDIVFTAYTESEAGMSDETREESTRMVSLRSKDGKIFSIADYFLKAASLEFDLILSTAETIDEIVIDVDEDASVVEIFANVLAQQPPDLQAFHIDSSTCSRLQYLATRYQLRNRLWFNLLSERFVGKNGIVTSPSMPAITTSQTNKKEVTTIPPHFTQATVMALLGTVTQTNHDLVAVQIVKAIADSSTPTAESTLLTTVDAILHYTEHELLSMRDSASLCRELVLRLPTNWTTSISFEGMFRQPVIPAGRLFQCQLATRLQCRTEQLDQLRYAYIPLHVKGGVEPAMACLFDRRPEVSYDSTGTVPRWKVIFTGVLCLLNVLPMSAVASSLVIFYPTQQADGSYSSDEGVIKACDLLEIVGRHARVACPTEYCNLIEAIKKMLKREGMVSKECEEKIQRVLKLHANGWQTDNSAGRRN